ncbi:MAG TPA: hypothetical protein PLC40_09060 [Candidatus Hydrogenedentes bacterium]|nr:hypothetical protein [Candidatus Hydrogenedentota bacterium]
MNPDSETTSMDMDAEEERSALERLKYRIINVIPPGTEYLEILLKLSEIQWTETITTAAITCGGSPRLLFNREFVDHYCTLDEDLMMLVLHELHHVLYGHHVLFQSAGEAHNIAFDAIINATLPGLEYRTARAALPAAVSATRLSRNPALSAAGLAQHSNNGGYSAGERTVEEDAGFQFRVGDTNPAGQTVFGVAGRHHL